MPILALEALLRENKKIQWKMLSPVGIESEHLITSNSKSNTIAWLYEEPKVSVLQANVNLVQKGDCWTEKTCCFGE